MEMGYELYCTMKEQGQVKEGHIGLRINSQYGSGAIEATSTATPTSKFGLPLKDTDFDELVFHVSKVASTGCPPQSCRVSRS